MDKAKNKGGYSIVMLGICVPWVLPYISEPIPAFYKEWIFVCLLLAATVTMGKGKVRTLPLQTPFTFAVAFIGCAAVVQMFVFTNVWPDTILLLGYLLVALFCYFVGAVLRDPQDSEKLLGLLPVIYGLLTAALISCLVGAFQLNEVQFDIPLILPRTREYIVSNLAQPNHLNTLLWLGAVAGGVLYALGKVRFSIFGWMAIIFACFSAFTASRSAWLFSLYLLGIGAISRKSTDLFCRKLSVALICVALIYPAVYLALWVFNGFDFFGVVTTAKRSLTEAHSGSLRLWLWKAAVNAIAENPWFGVGVGRFVGYSSKLTMELPDGPVFGADANAHNIFLHLGAELGGIVFVVLVGCAVAIGRTMMKLARVLEGTVVLAMVGLIFIHANLEYPLYYAYFLGVFSLLIGWLYGSQRYSEAHIASHGRWLNQGVMAATSVLACMAYWQYLPLERAMREVEFEVAMGGVPASSPSIDRQLDGMPAWSPFRDYYESLRLITIVPTRHNAEEISRRCDAALAFAPSPYLLSRCEAAYYLAGKLQRAEDMSSRICKIYPKSVNVHLAGMRYLFSLNGEDVMTELPCLAHR